DLFILRNSIENPKLWYRGHSKSEFKLIPSIGRTQTYAGHQKVLSLEDEAQILHRFRRRAFPYDPGVAKAGYALFLARHYGLPTRLLDWTANPLLGLYFAAFEHTDAEGTLWAFTQCPDAAVIDSFELAGEPSEYELLGMDLQGRTDPERIHRTDVKLVH